MSASTKKKERQLAREQGNDRKAAAAQALAEKKAVEKRKWTIGIAIVAVVLAAVLFINSSFLVNNSTAVTIGDESYNAGAVSYHLGAQYMMWANQYGSYAEILGLDTSNGISGLASQECPLMEDGSWRDYFAAAAEQEMLQIQVLCKYAEENGITLTEEEIAAVDAELEEAAAFAELMGYGNEKNFYVMNYGSAVTPEIAREESLRGTLANKVITEFTGALEYSAAELEEEYKSFNGEADYFNYSYYYTETEADAKAVLEAYNKSTGDDYSARLDAAVKSVEADSAAAIMNNTLGSNLSGSYKSWMMEQTKAGSATLSEGNNNDYYVVVFRSREDNHYNMANIRHILVKAEAAEDGTYSDEAKAAAKKAAEEILAKWESGEKTEESFAALANELSEDTGSNTNGGLYENVIKGQMVKEFDEFCFAGHQAGTTGIVYGESGSYAGYHVMYFVGEGQQYSDVLAKDSLATAALDALFAEHSEGLSVDRGFGFRFVG